MTVTGNPAEFTVNGVAATVNSLTVPFSPIQDLNGYANPWPGGGGKQLIPYPYKDTLPVTKTGVTFTDIGNGRIHAQGTATSIIYFTLLGSSSTPIPSWVKPNTTYTLRPQTASSKYFCQFILYGSPTYAATGSTFTTPNDLSEYTGFSLVIGIYNGAEVNDDISPMLEYGSTAHDWQPYSNICPISGRTGLSVYVSPTTYQADATTYAVDLTSEAGTVYHGTVDPVAGQLTVDWAYKEFNGTEGWFVGTNYIGLNNAVDYASKGNDDTTQISNVFVGAGAYYANYNSFRVQTNKAIVVGNKNEDGTVGRWADATAFKSFLAGLYSAGTPFAVCYELATPLTYRLTPQTINLLAGITNYVWSDTNEDITISFDVAAFIRQLFRVNGVDFSRFVERDSYATALEPVYAETIQTMDGVNHTALLRTRGSIRLRFNPQTDSDTAALCSALLAAPCEVQYRCLQRDVDVTALMCVDTISAQFLSRCLYLGDEWNQIESITLTEL